MYKYDAALSYESESQEFVKEVADYLRAEGWEVFFAPERKEEMLSEHLNSKLYQIYQKESLIKVLFVTEKYLESSYTMLEARRSLSSARENARRLIVVNFIGEKLPKELKSFVYIEGDNFSDEIAFLVSSRINELKAENSAAEKKEEKRRVEAENQTCNVAINNSGYIFGDNAKLDHVHINNLR
ncbi:MAG: toll/interleukin-1 receptor domain-containing protein [Lachnospiraceae bacterium]|nr:toll/interleukin-1 receptor domain-containing protein [Lachnospiraceae bacterium]